MKKISVIMPIYNRENFLDKSIKSVLNQTYKNWELIVVDDFSTDNTWNKLQNYAKADKRIKIYRNHKNLGSSASRNRGIKLSKGDYIIFLDSDDYFLPYAFEQRINFFEKYPEYDFLVFPVERENIETGDRRPWNQYLDPDPLRQFLNLDPAWQTMSPIWKRSSILKNNLKFEEKILGIEDAVFHILALAKGLKYKIISEAKPDAIYTEHSLPSLSQKGFSFKQRKGHIFFYRKYFESDLISEEYKKILQKTFDRFINRIAQKKEFLTILYLLSSFYWLKKLSFEQKKLLFKALWSKIKSKLWFRS